MFNQYFKTKHQSKGTELGLHMAYNIIIEVIKGSITPTNVTFTYKHKKYSGEHFYIKLPNLYEI